MSFLNETGCEDGNICVDFFVEIMWSVCLKLTFFNALIIKSKCCQMSWIQTQRAAVASRYATNLATHFPISLPAGAFWTPGCMSMWSTCYSEYINTEPQMGIILTFWKVIKDFILLKPVFTKLNKRHFMRTIHFVSNSLHNWATLHNS